MSVYLDYNATAPLRENAKRAMVEVLNYTGNPSSTHFHGRQIRKYIEKSRILIGQALNIEPSRLIFTSGATEANNIALKSFLGTVLISAAEHESVKNVREDAITIPLLENGIINLDILENLLKVHSAHQTVLVSIGAAHNETGIIQPLEEIIKLTKKYKVYFHSDATQAIGRYHYHWSELNMISASGHKVGGPMGVGFLMIDHQMPFNPLHKGGGQERSYRPGTENVSGIYGMAVAIEESLKTDWTHTCQLRDNLEKELQEYCSEIEIFGKSVKRLPNTSFLTMPGVKSEIQLMNFDLAGFSVSGGSACSSGKVKASSALKAMNIPDDQSECAIRISLNYDTTEIDINNFINAWKGIYKRCGIKK